VRAPRAPVIVSAPAPNATVALEMLQGGVLPFTVSAMDLDFAQFQTLRLVASAVEGPLFFSNSLVQTSVEITPASSTTSASKTASFNLEFRPAASFFGIARVSYFIRDDDGLNSLLDTVFINVVHVNHQPVATGFDEHTLENVPGNEGTVTRIYREWSYTDFDGSYDEYSLVITSLPARGSLTNGQGEPVVTASRIAQVDGVFTIFFTPVVSTFEESAVYTTFDFQICDDSMESSTNCSTTQTVRVFVHPVNHAPTSQNVDTTLLQNGNVRVNFPASDPDSWDASDSDLSVVVVSASGVGSFFLDSSFATPMPLSTLFKPRSVWYKPPRNVASPSASVPLASLAFRVVDDNTTFSESFNANLFVTPILQPPEYIGPARLVASQNIPADFLLATPPLFDNWNIGFNGIYAAKITGLPARGSLAVCDTSDTCTFVSRNGEALDSSMTEYLIGSSVGHVVFVADENTFGSDYAQITYAVTDNLGQTATITVTIDVDHINQRPKIMGYSWVDSSVVMNENETAIIRFRVADVDSPPTNLTLRLSTRSISRYEWKLNTCADNSTTSSCTEAAVVADHAFPARNQNPVPTFVQQSTCDHAPGYPVTEFSGCGLYYVMQFTPEQRRYSYQYLQLIMTVMDPEGMESDQQVVYVAVLPINDAPTIRAPDRYVGTVGAAQVGLYDPSNGLLVQVDDFDATRASQLLLEIEHVSGMTGEFMTGAGASGNCRRNTTAASEGRLAWSCISTVAGMNQMLSNATWKFDADSSTGDDSTTLRFTVDDQGSTSVDNLDPKTATRTIIFEYRRSSSVVTVAPTSNLLTIISIAASLLALIVIAAIVYRMRRKLEVPNDDYFAAGASAIASGIENPLFKQATMEFSSPLYRARERVGPEESTDEASASTSHDPTDSS
jgi:hypothetical protein